MGGLSKKAYQLAQLRQQSDTPVLALDAGGLLFKTTALDPRHAPQDKAAATGIAEAYAAMGIEAVGITAHDLAAGLDFFRDLARQHPLPWLSADLVSSTTGQPLFTPAVTRKVGELTVGIFGLSGPDAARLLRPENHATVLPWQEVAPRLIAQLNQTADLVILLSGLPEAENERLAQRHPDLHLIVRAGADGGNQVPRLTDNTLLLQTEKQGKYLGVLDITWTASKQWGEDLDKTLARARDDLDRIEWLIRSHQRQSAQGGRDADIRQQAYAELLAVRQQLQGEMARLEEKLASGSRTPASLYQYRFLALTTDLPDQPAVLSIVQATTRTINTLGQELARRQLEEEKNAADSGLPFVGWQKCAECHRTEADFWQQSRHAGAYETLRRKNQQFNLECLACHVTGLTDDGAPQALTLPAALQSVGCEACHGPGRDHSTDPARPMTRKPAPAVCLRCHTPAQDDNFDYDRDLGRLNCPHVRP